MGAKSLKIVARHDIGDTLAAFEELYELVSGFRRRGESCIGVPHLAGLGDERVAACNGRPVGGVHEVLGSFDALRR